MATSQYAAMVARNEVDFELREIDERILDELETARCTRRHLANLLGVSPDYIYQRVDLLEKLGVVDVIHDGFYELADSEQESDDTEPEFAEPEPQAVKPEPPTEPQTSATVEAVVERVSDGWQDTDERLAARRAAARAVLQHAVDTGDAVGKTDAIEEFGDEFGVDGQNDETWYRKNIRPVLREVGEYSSGVHGYVVDDLE